MNLLQKLQFIKTWMSKSIYNEMQVSSREVQYFLASHRTLFCVQIMGNGFTPICSLSRFFVKI